jgi:hypothetical protein
MPLHRGAPRAPKVRWAMRWLERKRLKAEILRGIQLMHLCLMLDVFNPILATAVLEAKDLQPFVMFSLLFPCVGKLKIAGIMQAASRAMQCYFERRNRAQGAEQREHLRVGVRPGVLPRRMWLRQLQHAGAGVSARPALAGVQRASGRGLRACPDLRLAKGTRPTSSGPRETSARPNAAQASTTTRHSTPRAAAGTAGTARSSRCTRASSSSSSRSLPATRRATRWAPYAQESGARLARTARLRVAAGVLRNQLPAAVAEHARAQQHRRGHLRPLRRGAWEAGRAKHMVTHILRRFTVKPILFALPRTNKFGLEN